MKELLFVCVLLHIHRSFGLKVIVSGYNSKIATYNVEGNSLSPSTEWDVGVAGEFMTWLQLDGDYIYGGHEVIEYQDATGMLSGHPDNVYSTPPGPAFVDFWGTSDGSKHHAGFGAIITLVLLKFCV